MARFNDLTDEDKIRYTKNEFVVLVSKLARDPSKFRELLQTQKPVVVEPNLLKITDKMSMEEKLAAQAVNNAAIAKAKEETDKMKQEEEEFVKKAELAISKLERNVGCVCKTCFNVGALNSIVPPELEPLIDIARKQIKEKTF